MGSGTWWKRVYFQHRSSIRNIGKENEVERYITSRSTWQTNKAFPVQWGTKMNRGYDALQTCIKDK